MPPPPKPDPTVPIGNSVFVSQLGGPDGLRNRLDKCFSDIPSAVAAAQAGDTVFVYPGSYTLSTPIQLRPGINFEFLGSGSVTSSVEVFSDKGQTGDSETTILARGWKFYSENHQAFAFAPKSANRVASLYFTFDAILGGEPVAIYAGAGRIILDGGLIHSLGGTPVQVNAGEDVNIWNCKITTESTANQDAILLWGNLTVENCLIEALGGKGGTDSIGMDGGKLIARNCKIVSEGANALTLRNQGSAELWNCDVIGDDSALTVAENLVIESNDCNFHCTGVGKNAVEIYRSAPAKIQLRGGKISSVEGAFDINLGWGSGEITVAGTTWDRTKGLPTREWIPGEGWRNSV